MLELAEGDFIGFSAAEQRAHMIVNHSSEPAVILTIGTHPAEDVTTFLEASS